MILPGIGTAGFLAGSSGGGSGIGTFDPANKSVHCTLSNGNLTAATNYFAGAPVMGTVSQSSGKRYLEMTFSPITLGDYPQIGVGLTTVNVNTGFGGTDSIVVASPGNGVAYIFYNGSYTTATGFSSGAIVGVAVDFSLSTIWFTANGVTIDGGVIGVSGGYPLPSGTLLPAANPSANQSDLISITLLTVPTYLPAGYSYWGS